MRRVLSDEDMKKNWRERFKAERKKSYPRQEDFANAMQKEGHATTKTTVGRWEKIGDNYGKEKPGFPSFPTMQSISKLLQVQIGYLIGESEGRTFDEQEVSEYLGISVEAVNALRELAARPGANNSRFKEKYGLPTTSYADTLEKVLTSSSFRCLIGHLNEVDCGISDFAERNAPKSRNDNANLLESEHCREYRLSPESNPERFDPDGHLVNESGARMFDPEDPERLGEEVIGMRNRVRMAKCLLIDDQMAMVREVWPQVVQLEEGVADLGDIVVQATENSCRVTEKS